MSWIKTTFNKYINISKMQAIYMEEQNKGNFTIVLRVDEMDYYYKWYKEEEDAKKDLDIIIRKLSSISKIIDLDIS